jgi:hypothetical protein
MHSKLLATIAAILAVTANASAFAATATMSFDSVLAAGYEVKSVMVLTDETAKQMWPGQTTPPQTLITLQKGSSVAVCTLSAANWNLLADASMANATLCATH